MVPFGDIWCVVSRCWGKRPGSLAVPHDSQGLSQESGWGEILGECSCGSWRASPTSRLWFLVLLSRWHRKGPTWSQLHCQPVSSLTFHSGLALVVQTNHELLVAVLYSRSFYIDGKEKAVMVEEEQRALADSLRVSGTR